MVAMAMLMRERPIMIGLVGGTGVFGPWSEQAERVKPSDGR